jgi:hypothetical protein
VLEVAAGTGHLSLFLTTYFAQRNYSVEYIATDNKEWEIPALPNILNMSATDSLISFSPDVVIISWPPPDGGWVHSFLEMAKKKKIPSIVIGAKNRSNLSALRLSQLNCCVPQYSFSFSELTTPEPSLTWISNP